MCGWSTSVSRLWLAAAACYLSVALLTGWANLKKPPLSSHKSFSQDARSGQPPWLRRAGGRMDGDGAGRQPWIIYHLMRTKDAVTSCRTLRSRSSR